MEVELKPSSNGRVSGKAWKIHQRRTIPASTRSKDFDTRMQLTSKNKAIKKLQTELREEKQAELDRRREITKERRKAAEERRRLEEDKAKMGARKATRLRRRTGRTKEING